MGFVPEIQGLFNIHKTIKAIHHTNIMKKENHMFISKDADRTFNKIQHVFMIKMLSRLGIEGTYLNIIKVIYEKHTTNTILNGGKLFLQNQEQEKDTHSLTTSIHYSMTS